MRQMLWLNNFPILPMHHRCSMQWLVNRFGGDLSTLDEDDLTPFISVALATASLPALQRSSAQSLSPALKLFWGTRLHPMKVPRAQLEIMVPQLTLLGTPLDASVTGKLILCSDRKNSCPQQ